MDSHGVLSKEVLVDSSLCTFSSPLATSEVEPISKRALLDSDFIKLGRSGGIEEDGRRCPKMSRSISYSCASNGEQMLSFSSPKSHSLVLTPLQLHSAASSELIGTGFNSEDLNDNMKGTLRRSSGPFTLFQKMELKRQMLIYNHIWANVPIPTNLLSSLMRDLNPSLLSGYSTGSLGHNAAWWGYHQPGFVGNADPEPGRCCRTDGKKWRCSRDAVPDQKYCERHINRGRHRSRKPVESHGGHAKKAMPKPTAASAVCSGSQSLGSLAVARHQIQKTLASDNTSSSPLWMVTGRNSANNGLETALDHSIPSAARPCNSLFASLVNYNPLGESTSLTFDSNNVLVNNLRTSLVANSSFITPLMKIHDQQSKQPLGHVVDDWPSSFGRTRLSVPLPLISSDFSSSSSSVPETFTPLHMGYGLTGVPNQLNSAQMDSKAVSWEAPSASMGGPLGEALSSKSSTPVDEKGFINLVNESWDLNLASSASNAVQSATLSSVSSGSANDGNVEKSNEGLSCLFAPKAVSSLNLPPFVSI